MERGTAIADIARRHRLNTVRFQDGYVNLRWEGRTCARSARVGQPTVTASQVAKERAFIRRWRADFSLCLDNLKRFRTIP